MPLEKVNQVKGPFDFVNAINTSQKDIMTDENKNIYNPYLTNRALSYFPDSILYANEMNRCHRLSNQQQYDFYRLALPKRKRFSKWFKAEESDEINAIMIHYKYSKTKAKEVQSLLSEDFLSKLLERYKYIQTQNNG